MKTNPSAESAGLLISQWNSSSIPALCSSPRRITCCVLEYSCTSSCLPVCVVAVFPARSPARKMPTLISQPFRSCHLHKTCHGLASRVAHSILSKQAAFISCCSLHPPTWSGSYLTMTKSVYLPPKVKCLLNCVWLIVTPWTVAHQVPPSMEFSRQEYWSG